MCLKSSLFCSPIILTHAQKPNLKLQHAMLLFCGFCLCFLSVGFVLLQWNQTVCARLFVCIYRKGFCVRGRGWQKQVQTNSTPFSHNTHDIVWIVPAFISISNCFVIAIDAIFEFSGLTLQYTNF